MENGSEENLDLVAQHELLHLARSTIEHYVNSGTRPTYFSDDPKLQSRSGVFVSLHKGSQLRGCIGYVTAEGPLYQTVIEAAISAATADPRFPPVTSQELGELEIEISVMTPPRVLENIEEIVVGRDGLIVTSGHFRGLLLPQVATEYGWDRETFLDHTCQKAGLPQDAWKKGDVTIESFSAQVFSESKSGN